jgi:predicted RNA-binding protein YlxR (DUF448 family)
LIRIVRNPEGIFVDPSGKMAGRGAYLHDREDCWKIGLQGPLESALKTEFSAEDRERLTDYMVKLSDGASANQNNFEEQ